MGVPFSELKIEEKVAEGRFRDVYKGVWRNEQVAIKILKNPDAWDKYVKEIDILRYLVNKLQISD